MTTPTFYEIRIRGHLGSNWADWFDGLRCTNLENGEAVLFGPVEDQAALHGVLVKVHNLNLGLISVNRVPPRTADENKAPG